MVSGEGSKRASLYPMRSLLLVLHLPICLPSATLSFRSLFKNVSPVIAPRSQEALHTHCGGKRQGMQRKSQSRMIALNSQASTSHSTKRFGPGLVSGMEVRVEKGCGMEQVSDALSSLPGRNVFFLGARG